MGRVLVAPPLARISARGRDRFASAGNHASQAVNDAACSALLGIAAVLSLGAWLFTEAERQWRDVPPQCFEEPAIDAGSPFISTECKPLRVGRHLEVS